ncbi:putative cytochrome P450 [Helianthus annuus]|nr:putative cytochrome P450 [Helianthus annuus]
MWKIHRDVKIWSDPYEFRPERFLTPDQNAFDVKWTEFEFSIPFGGGRRCCPGITFAYQTLHMVLATLLQNFEMSTQNGAPIDIPGLTNAKAYPLEVVVSPH